ncbi:MAG: hypothetical protein ACQES5_08740 [Thermodesulfobacteriota bacterium]
MRAKRRSPLKLLSSSFRFYTNLPVQTLNIKHNFPPCLHYFYPAQHFALLRESESGRKADIFLQRTLKKTGSSRLGMDFIRVIISDVPDERFAYFPALAKRGNTDRGTEHKNRFSNQLALPVTKTVSPGTSETEGGKHPPLAGLRKYRTESAASKGSGE